jgi:8-oxo-dGTP diphosphatase
LEEEVAKRPRVGLAAVAVREGEILLGKRKGIIGDATWAPPGGHLEYGESVEECASRELLEETGLVAKTLIRGPYTNNLIAPKGQHYVTLFVLISEFEGKVECREPQKCLGWEWFPFESLPTPLITSFDSFIQEHPSFLLQESV